MITGPVKTVGDEKYRKYAADQFNIDPRYIEYFTYPKTFGSTAGPFGGIGGAAMTTFQIEAYSNGAGQAFLYANGRFWKKSNSFSFAAND